MSNPKVSIIILNWNGWKDTLECLDSLAKIDYPNYEIIVVDNGSTDESVSQLRIKNQELGKLGRSFVLIENSQNLGFAGGNNVGIDYAVKNGADYVLLLNNDTTVDKNFLSELIEVGETNPKAGILGPKIYYCQESNRIWFGGGALKWIPPRGYHLDYDVLDQEIIDSIRHSERERGIPRECENIRSPTFVGDSSSPLAPQNDIKKKFYNLSMYQEVDYITGCCLLVKSEVIKKIGVMSDDYFLYYEDSDWCLRAKKAGWVSLYVPEAKIYHKVSRSAKAGSPSYIYYHTRNGLMLVKRNGPLWAKILLYPYTLYLAAKQFIKLLIPSKRDWARAVLEGIKDFYSGKMGEYKKNH